VAARIPLSAPSRSRTAGSKAVRGPAAPDAAQKAPAASGLLPQAPSAIPAGPLPLPAVPLPPLALQRKLAIGSSDDPLEREADRAAHAAENPYASPIPARAPGRAAPALTQAPPLVHRVLRSPGHRLDESTLSWAESAFQSGFGNVRLHTGPEAEQSAAEVRARAYTVGSHIVLGPGRSSTDRPLLAHELAHVVQQGMAPTQHAPHEAPARAALPHRATSPLVQRQDADDTRDRDLGWVTEKLIKVASAPALAIGDTTYDLVHATWHGFVAEVKDHGGEAADKVWDNFKDFVTSPSQLALFFPKYWWGLIKGIFSPITGLFDLGKLGIQLIAIGGHAAETAWENRDKIVQDAEALGASMVGLGAKAKAALKSFIDHPIDSVKALLPLLDEAKSQATAAAEKGGHSVARMLLAATDKPIDDLAEVGGEVIGTVAVNVALFVLTDGIGDAIVQIAGKLGEVAGWLAKFGKTAEMLAGVVAKLGELLTTVGAWVTRAEAFIGKMISTVLKPLEPVLEEFGGLMGKLRTFLKDLLGVAEKESAQEASAAAKAIKGATKDTPALKPPEPPPPPKPHPPEPKPHAPEPKPKPPEPKPHAPEPKPKPHVPEPEPKPHAPEPKPKPHTPEPKPKPHTHEPEPKPKPHAPEPKPKPKPHPSEEEPHAPAKKPAKPEPKPAKKAPPAEEKPPAAPKKKPAPKKSEPPPHEKPAEPAHKPPEHPPDEAPKEPTHEEKARAKEAADKAKRVEEIDKELAPNNARMKELDKDIQAAKKKAEKSGNDMAAARGEQRDQLEKKWKKDNREVKRLEDEKAKIQRRNDELYAERRRLTRPADPATWQDAEDYLREEFSGKKKSIKINDELGERDIDCWTPDGIARESKHGGPFDLSDSRIKLEIKKDTTLLKQGKVKSVEWHFYRNPASPRYGPTDALEKELQKVGIKVVRH